VRVTSTLNRLPQTEPEDSAYYAREAEKDLRKHLRKRPDDIEALKKLALAVATYQTSDRARVQRLNSIG
jgi:DNA-dependent RNA polymerase auxiliary subunit epsilon